MPDIEGETPALDTSTVLGAAMKEGEKPEDKPEDKPADKPEDKPADKPEDKPADKPEDKPADKPEDKPADKPTEYTDFTIPEGMELDKTTLERFTGVAQGEKLTQEQAQKYVSFYAEEVQRVATAQVEEWAKVRTEWLETARADEEIGGAKFDASLENAAKALRQFGTPALAETLDTLGVGNHPEIVRFCARIGAAISEDTINPGAPPGGEEKTQAQRIFTSMAK